MYLSKSESCSGRSDGVNFISFISPSDQDTSDFEITVPDEDDKPPEYSQASRFPVS